MQRKQRRKSHPQRLPVQQGALRTNCPPTQAFRRTPRPAAPTSLYLPPVIEQRTNSQLIGWHTIHSTTESFVLNFGDHYVEVPCGCDFWIWNWVHDNSRMSPYFKKCVIALEEINGICRIILRTLSLIVLLCVQPERQGDTIFRCLYIIEMKSQSNVINRYFNFRIITCVVCSHCAAVYC